MSAHLDQVYALGEFYRERIGWPPKEWHHNRLAEAGKAYGVRAAEVFDAWESEPGLYASLFESAVLPPL